METILQSVSSSVKHWYLPLILGILLIICGIWVLQSPASTYVALSILFSVSFIVSGLTDIVFSLANSSVLRGWGWYLVSGLLSLVLGIYLAAYPGVSMSILPYVVGFTLLFRSFLLLGFSFDLRDMGVKGWGYTTFLGVLGIIFCFLLLANPVFTSMSIVVMTSLAFIFTGFASIALSINLKKIKNSVKDLNA